jgi:hypothetical protein
MILLSSYLKYVLCSPSIATRLTGHAERGCLYVQQYNSSGFLPDLNMYRQFGLAAIDVGQVRVP